MARNRIVVHMDDVLISAVMSHATKNGITFDEAMECYVAGFEDFLNNPCEKPAAVPKKPAAKRR